jgi:amino acid adenylation domain-containing protein
MQAQSSQAILSSGQTFPGLLQGFIESARRFPARPALLVDGQEITYEVLLHGAARIATAITSFQPEHYQLGAILAARSVTAYAGILGILASGKGYVPLNPRFPVERSQKMLARSGARVLIVDEGSRAHLPGLLSAIENALTVIVPESEDVTDLAAALPGHRFVSRNDLIDPSYGLPRVEVDPGATAYLLFTSGSTGEPKGVPISHSNVCSYVRATSNYYQVNECDRHSQEFDLTFDLSVHDMFVTWERGACLCCVPEKSVMAPAKFIRDSRLTLWFSVPSVVGLLSKLRLLAPGSLPTLRCSLFCGEPLPAAYAQQWQEAAPNSIVENLYGPTETTIAITRYRWDSRVSPGNCLNGVVPIGWPFDGQRVSVVGQGRRQVPPGEGGELCLAGSQVTRGYWNNQEKTDEQFVRLPEGGGAVWYRTGDLVKQKPDGCLLYLGRVDHQVKIRGYRVELQEIEGVLREACGTEQVAAVPWPISSGNAEGIVAFVSGLARLDSERALERCRKILPDYMVPRTIRLLEEMPLNSNGKIDRKRLTSYLEDGQL